MALHSGCLKPMTPQPTTLDAILTMKTMPPPWVVEPKIDGHRLMLHLGVRTQFFGSVSGWSKESNRVDLETHSVGLQWKTLLDAPL